MGIMKRLEIRYPAAGINLIGVQARIYVVVSLVEEISFHSWIDSMSELPLSKPFNPVWQGKRFKDLCGIHYLQPDISEFFKPWKFLRGMPE